MFNFIFSSDLTVDKRVNVDIISIPLKIIQKSMVIAHVTFRLVAKMTCRYNQCYMIDPPFTRKHKLEKTNNLSFFSDL